jgi:phosphate starvation-inducible PhoH-like protein
MAKGVNQRKYSGLLENEENKVVVVYGPAGTGKTLLSCLKGIKSLKKGEYSKIILTRPVVSVEEELGYLPGDIVKKMDPWTRPIFDILMEHYSRSEISNMIYNNVIEISPLAYMRGRTFKNAFIIADEMQNSSPNQMMMLTTRIGKNSRMVITGDVNQSDKSKENGLSDLIKKVKMYNEYKNVSMENSKIKLIELDENDIDRSEVVREMIEIYNLKSRDVLKSSKKSSELVSFVLDSENKNCTVINYNYNYNINSDAALIPKSNPFRKIWEQ